MGHGLCFVCDGRPGHWELLISDGLLPSPGGDGPPLSLSFSFPSPSFVPVSPVSDHLNAARRFRTCRQWHCNYRSIHNYRSVIAFSERDLFARAAVSGRLITSSDPGTCPPPPPSSKPHSPIPILKRSRSPSLPVLTMDPDLPPAPQIDGEAMLEIFVHPSIRFTGMPLNSDSPYGDGKRLAILGGKALDAAFTHLLFDKRPMMTADTLDVRYHPILSFCLFPLLQRRQCEVRKLPELIEKWVEGYKWREKVRHAKDVDIRTSEVRPRQHSRS